MKIFQLIIFTLLSTIGIAQNNPTGYEVSQSASASYDKPINYSTVTEGRYTRNAFTIIYDGNITSFINKLKIDLKNVQVISDEKTHKRIIFKDFRKFEWSGKKLTIKLDAISNINKNMITIVCYDDDNNDLLEIRSETSKKIRDYIAELLK